MIKTFAHKGLYKFWSAGSIAGIQPKHDRRLRIILTALDSANDIKDLNAATFRLHQLKGRKKELWSMTVNGNWRITFRFEDGDAYIVDYMDYH